LETWGILILKEGQHTDKGLKAGYHPLGPCPPTYAAHANKMVLEPFQKEQCSVDICSAKDPTLLIPPACQQILTGKVDQSNKLTQGVSQAKAVDS
jgi:hypothetical protein